MEGMFESRPLQPVSLTLDLIRAFFKPGGIHEYEVPLSETISHYVRAY